MPDFIIDPTNRNANLTEAQNVLADNRKMFAMSTLQNPEKVYSLQKETNPFADVSQGFEKALANTQFSIDSKFSKPALFEDTSFDGSNPMFQRALKGDGFFKNPVFATWEDPIKLEKIYNDNQSYGQAIGNAFSKLVDTNNFAFKNYFLEYGDILDAVKNTDLSKLWTDPRFDQYIKDMEQVEIDNPTFDGGGWKDWVESIAPSIGFTTGMMGAAILENQAFTAAGAGVGAMFGGVGAVPGAAIGEAAAVTKTIAQGIKGLLDYKKLKSAIEASRAAFKAKTLAGKAWDVTKFTGKALQIFNAAASEIGVENADFKATNTKAYMDDVYEKTGRTTLTEVEQKDLNSKILQGQRTNFFTQLPMLSVSNYIALRNLGLPGFVQKEGQKLANSIVGRIVNTGTAQAVNYTNEALGKKAFTILGKNFLTGESFVDKAGRVVFNNKVSNFIGKYTRDNFREGLEELAQAGSQGFATGTSFGKDKTEDGSIGNGFSTAFNAMTSQQGMSEFAAGFVTGSPFMGLKGILNFAAGKATIEEGTLKVTKNNFLQKMGIMSNKEAVQRAEVTTENTNLLKKLNDYDLQKLFGEDGFINTMRNLKLEDYKKLNTVNATLNDNAASIFNVNNASVEQFGRYLFRAFETGRTDLVKSELEDTLNLSNEQFADKMGIDVSDVNMSKGFLQTSLDNIDKQKATYDSISPKYKQREQAVGKLYNEKLTPLNTFKDELNTKYNITEDEGVKELNERISDEDKIKYFQLEQDFHNTQLQYHAITEGFKVHVLAANALEDSYNKVKENQTKLDKIDSKYADLNNLVSKKGVDEEITKLEAKLAASDLIVKQLQENSDASTQWVNGVLQRPIEENKKLREQLENLKSLQEIYNTPYNFLNQRSKEDDSNADLNSIAEFSDYTNAIHNYLGIESPKKEQNDLLLERIAYETRQRTNLELLDKLENDLFMDNFIKNTSVTMLDFLEQVKTKNAEAFVKASDELNKDISQEETTPITVEKTQEEIDQKAADLLAKENLDKQTQAKIQQYDNAINSIDNSKTKEQWTELYNVLLNEETELNEILDKRKELQDVINSVKPVEEVVLTKEQEIEKRRQEELNNLLPTVKKSEGQLDFSAAFSIGIPEFYQQLFEMVEKGEVSIAGVKEKNAPLLQKLYNEGKIKNKEDVWLALNPNAIEINKRYDKELADLKNNNNEGDTIKDQIESFKKQILLGDKINAEDLSTLENQIIETNDIDLKQEFKTLSELNDNIVVKENNSNVQETGTEVETPSNVIKKGAIATSLQNTNRARGFETLLPILYQKQLGLKARESFTIKHNGQTIKIENIVDNPENIAQIEKALLPPYNEARDKSIQINEYQTRAKETTFEDGTPVIANNETFDKNTAIPELNIERLRLAATSDIHQQLTREDGVLQGYEFTIQLDNESLHPNNTVNQYFAKKSPSNIILVSKKGFTNFKYVNNVLEVQENEDANTFKIVLKGEKGNIKDVPQNTLINLIPITTQTTNTSNELFISDMKLDFELTTNVKGAAEANQNQIFNFDVKEGYTYISLKSKESGEVTKTRVYPRSWKTTKINLDDNNNFTIKDVKDLINFKYENKEDVVKVLDLLSELFYKEKQATQNYRGFFHKTFVWGYNPETKNIYAYYTNKKGNKTLVEGNDLLKEIDDAYLAIPLSQEGKANIIMSFYKIKDNKLESYNQVNLYDDVLYPNLRIYEQEKLNPQFNIEVTNTIKTNNNESTKENSNRSEVLDRVSENGNENQTGQDSEQLRKEKELNKPSLIKTELYSVPILLDPKAKVRGDVQEYITRKVFDKAFNNDDKEGIAFQTGDTLIRRGGYSTEELNKLLPNWRELLPTDINNNVTQEEPVKKKTRKVNDNDAPLNQTIDLFTQTLPSISQEEIDFTQNLVNQVPNAKLILEKIANSKYYGRFIGDSITLFSNAKQGTGYHESWHFFSQLFLTKEQKEQLYEETRNKVKSLKKATLREIEEYIADDFKEFMQTSKSALNKPVRNTFFRQIQRFFQDLFNKIFKTSQPSQIDIAKLYKALQNNDLAEFTPSIDNAMFAKLNATIKKEDGSVFFTNSEEQFLRGRFFGILNDITEKKNFPYNIQNTSNAEYVKTNVVPILFTSKTKEGENNSLVYNAFVEEYNQLSENNDNLISTYDKLLDNWTEKTATGQPLFAYFFNYVLDDKSVLNDEVLQYFDDVISTNNEDNEISEVSEKSDAQTEEEKDVEYKSEKQSWQREEEVSPYTKASSDVRAFLRGTPQADNKATDGYKRNVDTNLIEYVQPLDFYNRIIKLTGGKVDDIYNVVKIFEENKKQLPELSFLIRKINQKLNNKILNEKDNYFLNNLVISLGQRTPLSAFDVNISEVEEGGITSNKYSVNKLEANNKRKVIESIRNNQIAARVDAKLLEEYFVKTPTNIILKKFSTTPDVVLNIINNNVEDIKDLLKVFGMEELYQYISDKNVKDRFIDFYKTVYNYVNNKDAQISDIQSFINQQKEIETKDFVLGNYFSAIVGYLSNKAENDVKNSSVTYTQKGLFNFVLPFYVSEFIQQAKKKTSLFQQVVENPYRKRKSQIIENDDIQNIELLRAASFTKQNDDRRNSDDYDTLNDKERFLSRLIIFDQGWLISPPNKNNTTLIWKTKNIKFPKSLINYQLDILKAELELIKTGEHKSLVITNVFNEDLTAELLTKGITSENEQQVKDALALDIENRNYTTKELFLSLGITDKIMSDKNYAQYIKRSNVKSFDELIEDFTKKYYVSMVEWQTLFMGSQEGVIDFFKRDSLTQLGKQRMMVDNSILNNIFNKEVNLEQFLVPESGDAYTTAIKQTEEKQLKFMQALTANKMLGAPILTDYSTMKVGVLKEIQEPGQSIELMKAIDVLKQPHLSKEQQDDATQTIKEYVEANSKQKTADATGFVTMEAALLVRQSSEAGNIKPQDYEALHYENAYLRRAKIWGEKGKETNFYEYYKNANNLSQDFANKMQQVDNKILNKTNTNTIPAIKSGSNSLVVGKNKVVKDKYALITLVPSQLVQTDKEGNVLTYSPNLYKLLEMSKTNTFILRRESGTKGYKHDTNINDYLKTSPVEFELNDDNTYSFYTVGYGVIRKTEPFYKSSSSFGTQMKVLASGSLFSNGEINSPLLKPTIDNYNNNYKLLLDEYKTKFLKDLGLDSNYNITDKDKLQETLSRISKNSLISEDAQELISNETIDFILTSPQKDEVEKIITSLFYKSHTGIKAKIAPLVQVSSVGFEQYDWKTKKPISQYQFGLRDYEPILDKDGIIIETRSAQAKLAFNSNFYPLLNLVKEYSSEINTIEEGRQMLNKALQNPEFVKEHQKELTLVGYRIPTGGLNYMESLEVAEFLPESFQGIILPPGIVSKSGSDFDDDKMNIILPTYNTLTGKLLTRDNVESSVSKKEYNKYIKDVTAQINEIINNNEGNINKLIADVLGESEEDSQINDIISLKEQREELIKKSLLSQNNKDIIMNDLSQNLNEIITSRDTFFQLIKPNQLNILKDIVQNLQTDLLPSRRNSLYNIETKEARKFTPVDVMYPISGFTYEVTKQWGTSLGLYALNNKMLTYIQRHNILQNDKFNVYYLSKEKQNLLSANNFVEATYSELTNHNPLLSKPMTYSDARNEIGQLKSSLNDEGLTGTVDASSDPTFAALGIPKKDMPLLKSLQNEGVSLEKATYFLRNKVIDSFNAYLITNDLNKNSKKDIYEDIFRQNPENFGNISYYATIQRYNKIYSTSEAELKETLNQFVKLDENGIPEYSPYQLQMIGYYLALQERSKIELSLQNTMQIDTKKVQNTYDANRKLEELNEVKKSGLFQQEGIDSFFKSDFLAPHASNNKDYIKLMNTISNGMYSQQLLKMSNIISKKLSNKRVQERLFNSFQGNFITFLFDKYATYNGKSLENYRQELLIKDSVNKKTTIEEFYQVLNKHPELQTNEFVKILIPSIHPNLQEVHNFSASDSLEKTIDNYDIIHEAYNSLLNNSNKEISDVFLKIGHIAFLQSGLNYSVINYNKLIPSAPFKDLTNSVVNNWKNETNKEQVINEFYNKFIRQNKELLGIIDDAQAAPLLEEQRYVSYADEPFTSVKKISTKEVQRIEGDNKENNQSTTQSKRGFVTEQNLKEKASFRKKPLIFGVIPTTKSTPVGARNIGTAILLDLNVLKDKYNEKAWTKSATQLDGSQATPLSENQFNSFEDFLTFVLLHEIKHDTIKKQEGQTTGEYETQINNAALQDLNDNYNKEDNNNLPDINTCNPS